MPNVYGLYPLSAPDGTPIPLDVYWPIATFPLTLVAGAAQNGIVFGNPAPDFLLVWSAAAMYLQFGANFAGVPAAGVRQPNGCIYIPANWTDFIPVYHDEAANFSVWPIGSGQAVIILCSKWKDTKKLSQFTRN